MKLTSILLSQATGSTLLRASQWVDAITKATDKFSISTPLRMAAFLAEVGHESAGLSAVEENLNYRAEALLSVFKTHFPSIDIANQYAHNPEKIANRVYANRMGNGPEASGDGYKYRGRGPIQLTGKDNYIKAGKALGVDLVNSPELVATPEVGALVAVWYWDENKLSSYADKGDITSISKIINTGSPNTPDARCIGLVERARLYSIAVKALS